MPLWITCADVDLLPFVLLWEEEIEIERSAAIVSSDVDSLLVVDGVICVDAMEATLRPPKIADLGSLSVQMIDGAVFVDNIGFGSAFRI